MKRFAILALCAVALFAFAGEAKASGCGGFGFQQGIVFPGFQPVQQFGFAPPQALFFQPQQFFAAPIVHQPFVVQQNVIRQQVIRQPFAQRQVIRQGPIFQRQVIRQRF